MKKISLLIFFAAAIFRAYPQVSNTDLPAEFKDVAARAFQKLSPATKQWFINTASQHPPGSFDTAWAKKKLREKFGAADINSTGELFMVMMAYQRMMNKETREDRKMVTANKQMELTSKENKLKLDNAKIDQQKKEASEKADNAMTSAQISLWTGIVSGTLTAGNGPGQANQKISTVRLSPTVTQKIDSLKLKVKDNNSSQQAQKAEQEKKNADDAKKASDEQKKKEKDAIQKLLDQMRRMKPDI
ncbi:MAG: hypothetical protein ACHQEB_03095 [Chitinophagales bacterium]